MHNQGVDVWQKIDTILNHGYTIAQSALLLSLKLLGVLGVVLVGVAKFRKILHLYRLGKLVEYYEKQNGETSPDGDTTPLL